MTITTRAVKKIILMMIPVLLLNSTVFASEVYPAIDTAGSIYRYNALENKIYFGDPNSLVETDTSSTLPENIDPTIADAEKLQEITNRENVSIKKSEAAMKVINDVDGITSFLIGNNLGILKFQTMQMKDQIYNLNILFLKTKDMDIEAQINKQLEGLNKEKQKVENFILEQDGKFSLFGWLVASI